MIENFSNFKTFNKVNESSDNDLDSLRGKLLDFAESNQYNKEMCLRIQSVIDEIQKKLKDYGNVNYRKPYLFEIYYDDYCSTGREHYNSSDYIAPLKRLFVEINKMCDKSKHKNIFDLIVKYKNLYLQPNRNKRIDFTIYGTFTDELRDLCEEYDIKLSYKYITKKP